LQEARNIAFQPAKVEMLQNQYLTVLLLNNKLKNLTDEVIARPVFICTPRFAAIFKAAFGFITV